MTFEAQMMVYAVNPGTWETEAGRSEVQGQPGYMSSCLRKQTRGKERQNGFGYPFFHH